MCAAVATAHSAYRLKMAGTEANRRDSERKRILLIGEKPDAWLFATLQDQGYEVAAVEFSHRAWDVYLSYQPHLIVAHFRYPKDLAKLEECVPMGNGVPVVVVFSILTKKALLNAVKEKAAAVIVLPAKPQTIRETLRSLELSEDEGQFPSFGKESLGNN